MRSICTRTVLVCVTACLAAGWFAPAGAAVTMQDMVREARQLREAEAKLAQQREAQFRKVLADQERKLQDALKAKAAAEKRSDELSNRWDQNEVRIREMTQLLKQHEGNLGELFGVTRQVAGDSATVLQESLITLQFPPAPGEESRGDFMRRVAAAKALPSIVELERLWLELLREMTAGARTARFEADVLGPDNKRTKRTVTRVGPFTATADGEYLAYLPSTQTFAVMTRQPGRDLRNMAVNLEKSKGPGYVTAVADPARGALLAMYVERPNFVERIMKGEMVGYVILVVGFLGALVALFQYVYLFITRFNISRQLRNLDRPNPNNPLGRLMLAVRNSNGASDKPELTELRISEAVLREVPRLERFQSFLRLAVAAGPLLGLIGTVIGMIITFQAITASGTSDPKLMAHGIGQAMIATVLGLGIAIPLLFVNAGLASLSRSIVQILDEYSTGILAERLRARTQS